VYINKLMREQQCLETGIALTDAHNWDMFLKKEKAMQESWNARVAALRLGCKDGRIPAAGEAVKFNGMRQRPHLNGAKGEVVGGVDERGYFTVRIRNDAGDRAVDDQGEPKKMKVRGKCLQPMRSSASSPALTAVSLSDGQESMFTASDSMASRSRASRSSRSLGSGAVGAAARGALSRGGSVASTATRTSRATSTSEISSHWHKQHINATKKVCPAPSWVIGSCFGSELKKGQAAL
jgi:hypothetical protein